MKAKLLIVVLVFVLLGGGCRPPVPSCDTDVQRCFLSEPL